MNWRQHRKSVTWTGLQAAAAYELSNAAHEKLTGEKLDQEGVFKECTEVSKKADQALAAWAREEEQLTGLQRAHADHAENAGAQQDLALAQAKTTRQEEVLKEELHNFRQLLQNASSNVLLAQWQPALAQAAQQLAAFSWEQNQVDQDALRQIIQDLGEPLKSAAAHLNEEYDVVKELLQISKDRLKTIGLGMERANTNRAQVSESTARLMHEL